MFKSFIAPIKVTKHFRYFALWWLIIVVTLMGPVVDALLQSQDRFDYFIMSGALYYNIITLLFSAMITSIIDMVFEKIHDKGNLEFFHYQIVSFAFSLISIIVLIFLYILYRENAWLQIVLSILGYPFCYYLYCISCMTKVKVELNEFSLSYDNQRKEHSKEVQSGKSKSSDGINLDGGNA